MYVFPINSLESDTTIVLSPSSHTLTLSFWLQVFEPLEEGLDVVESKRYVSCITITLSTTGAGMNFDDIGYQVRLCDLVSELHSESDCWFF